ncbi:hypothetical protein ASA1KI_30150 [Opitutales bacterium ASA1]|nr:hypothetical protein ASA1KI_30150 [Opitutales bacterium ASA1]
MDTASRATDLRFPLNHIPKSEAVNDFSPTRAARPPETPTDRIRNVSMQPAPARSEPNHSMPAESAPRLESKSPGCTWMQTIAACCLLVLVAGTESAAADARDDRATPISPTEETLRLRTEQTAGERISAVQAFAFEIE